MAKMLLICMLLICTVAGKVIADEWWESGHFYQVYPRSFKDSDGDGIGDINGITSKLPHLKSIGVTAIWLSPIFKSPMKDFGYDISDFKEIQPEYGTMEDFEKLIARGKEIDIKIILDFVPNHCSDQHEWFQKAINTTDPQHEQYRDYFVWHKGKVLDDGTRVPPSNWLSIFRGSAWKWNDDVQAYYLHQFLEEQPDLNYRNKVVSDEMKEVLRFWLRKGVNGFRIDAVPFIFEGKENAEGYYDDEPRSNECNDDPEASCYLNHTQTKDLDETYEEIYQWREVVDEEEFASKGIRILMAEGYTSLPNTIRYYGEIVDGEIVRYGTHIPFNFMLLSNTWMGTGSYGYLWTIQDWIKALPKGKGIHSNWVLGNHDNSRIASKYKPSRIDLYNILLKTLPGITVTYYGEELGMTNVRISWEDTVDPQACLTSPDKYEFFSRDPERTPYQWDFSRNSGFSTANKTWLPLAKNYTFCNVVLQNYLIRSHLKVFRDLAAIRENPTMKYGDIQIDAIDPEILVYKRSIDNDPDADIIVVILNLEGNRKTINLNEKLGNLPEQLKVLTTSIHSKTFFKGKIVNSTQVDVSPNTGAVLIGLK